MSTKLFSIYFFNFKIFNLQIKPLSSNTERKHSAKIETTDAKMFSEVFTMSKYVRLYKSQSKYLTEFNFEQRSLN